MAEHRTWLTIPNLPFADEQAWESIITALERDHGDRGPVISFEPDGSATIVVADDTPDAAHAARGAVATVVDTLRTVGRGDLYPTAVEGELVTAHQRQIDPDPAERFVWRAGDVAVPRAKGKPPR